MPRHSPVSGVAGSVRIQRLSGPALSAAEAHGKRLDHAGKARRVREAAPLTSTGLNLKERHESHVEGAQRRKGAPEALHMVLQFPTALIDAEHEQGAMFAHARRFGRQIFGDDAIFADRMDQDEKSRHVVDLFLAPKYTKTTKRGSKLAVSTSIHLKKLAKERGKAPTLRGQGQALQDAWFEYLRDEMKLDVKRGSAKKLPGDDWQTPEQLEQERQREELAAKMTSHEVLTMVDAVILHKSRDAIADRERAMQAEAARIIREALSEAKGIRLQATDWANEKRSEALRRLPEAVKQMELWKAFVESTKATLQRLLNPSDFEMVRKQINEDWAKNAANPDRPAPTADRGRSGPSR